MREAEKLAVIGLDGATFDWLQPLAQVGTLPCLGKLLSESSWGPLESTVPPFTATAWSSFATGLNPGEHGILSFEKRDKYFHSEVVDGFADADQLKLTLWEIISSAGKTVGVVNVPLSYPSRPVNGYMVTGMMTPPNAERATFPAELQNELTDYRFDVDFIRDGDNFSHHINEGKSVMLVEIRDVMKRRIEHCHHWISRNPTDFFMVVFTCTDRLSHFFWDELCDVVAGRLPSPLHQGVLDLLIELDQGIQKLMDLLGSDTAIMLMSDHGFGTSPKYRAHLNVWLEKNNWLVRRQRESVTDLEYWRVRLGQYTWLKKIVRSILPQKSQDNLAQIAQENSNGIIDWANTRAFFVPIYFNVCGIAINKAGEMHDGNVTNAAEYHALRNDILVELKRLKDPSNGRSIISRLWNREDLYSGSQVDQFPDIIVELDYDYVGAQSLAGSQIVEPHIPFRSGEHRDDGIFALRSNKIQTQQNLAGLRLEDVAATILYTMGIPVPDMMSATLQTQLFRPDILAKYPPTYQTIVSSFVPPSDLPELDEDAEQLIEQRLRGLGYLE